MKTPQSIEKAADGAMKKARKAFERLYVNMSCMTDQNHNTARFMPHIRRDLAELNQRLHEYNAYRNCLETE